METLFLGTFFPANKTIYSEQALPGAARRCFLLFVFIGFTSILTPAQQLITPETISASEGLGYREVTAIAQDSKGLMWFGTLKGLNLFDGESFKHFGPNRKGDEYFPANHFMLNSMHFKNDSLLWAVADHQLFSMSMKNFRVQKVEGIGNKIWRLWPGKKNDFWLVSETEKEQFLHRFTDKKGFELKATVPRLREQFTEITTDTSGNVWWTTNVGGVQKYSPEGTLLHEAKLDSFIWFGSKLYYTPFFVDSRGRVFVFPKSVHEIWQYFPESGRIKVVAKDLNKSIYRGFEDGRGDIWFGNREGLFRLSKNGQFTDFSSLMQAVMNFTIVNAFYQDRTNVLWIGTDGGLFKIPVRNQLFDSHLSDEGVSWGAAMRGFAEGKNGQLYFYCEGGDLGIHQLDLKTGKREKIDFKIPPEEAENKIGLCKSLLFDPAQYCLWMMNGNLLKINLLNNTLQEIEVNLPDLTRYKFNPMARLPDGRLLLGGSLAELTLFHHQTNASHRLIEKPPDGFSSTTTKFFLTNEKGEIWVGTVEDGLYLLDSKGNVTRHLNTRTQPALNNDHVLCLHLDETEKQLWIGTFGGGVNRLDLTTGKVDFLTQQDGLADDNVVGILADQDDLWIATYNGLSCFHKKEKTFQNFFEEDGLSHNEFNYMSFFKSSDGQMHFGGLNGINSFFPQKVLHSELNPPLQLTGFTKYNHRLDSLFEIRPPQPIEMPVVISPSISYFQFEWTVPNFFRSNKNQYFSWLEGLDEDWSFLGHTPRIRFNNLPPGKYVLHLKGADSRGNRAEGELAIPIVVREAFYRRWWFLLGCAGLLAAVVSGINRFRYQRKLEMEKMRTKIASDLHDEVGSMLSGLAMQAEILEMQTPEAGQSTLTYLKDVSRSAVAKMRDMVWSIDSRRDSMGDLLDRMREHAEETFPPLHIFCEIKTAGLKEDYKLPVNVRQHLYLIYKEATTNIIKHSNADRVDIFIGNKNGRFQMAIRDNGSHFQKGKKATGLGLSNMRMRAEELGAVFSAIYEGGFSIKVEMKKSL